jgi:putative hydrolase of the HAD superfamily
MLYVFDLDDTLYLERDYVYSGFQAVGDWLYINRDISDFCDSAWKLFESGHRGNIFDLVLKKKEIKEDGLINLMVWEYRNHMPNIRLLPDAEEFISQVPFHNLAIITDGYSVTQWKKIKALNLESKIEQIIVTDDLGQDYWKPNPKAFTIVEKELSPKRCVYIADNPNKDFKAPKELGWLPSIRVRRKGSLHYGLSTPEDCREVISFNEIK